MCKKVIIQYTFVYFLYKWNFHHENKCKASFVFLQKVLMQVCVCVCPNRWLLIQLRLRTRRPMLPRSLWRDRRWWSKFPLHGEYSKNSTTKVVDVQLSDLYMYFPLVHYHGSDFAAQLILQCHCWSKTKIQKNDNPLRDMLKIWTLYGLLTR